MPIYSSHETEDRNTFHDFLHDQSRIKNEYLDRVDLTAQDIEDTHLAYNRASALYAELEWSRPIIDNVWRDVFEDYLKDTVKNLPEGSIVYVPGCGTGKDALTFSLLNRGIFVFASDISLPMLQEGKRHLDWEYISYLARAIYEMGGDTNGKGWISRIITHFAGLEEDLPEFADFMKNKVVDNIQSRFLFFNGKLEETYLPSNSVDLIFSSANLQHLDDDALIEACAEDIELLKPGGIAQLNLRIDFVPKVIEGRAVGKVFRDDALGLWRYYNTLSTDEVRYLLRTLKKQFGDQILITVGDKVTYHPDSRKPGFQHIQIVKKY